MREFYIRVGENDSGFARKTPVIADVSLNALKIYLDQIGRAIFWSIDEIPVFSSPGCVAFEIQHRQSGIKEKIYVADSLERLEQHYRLHIIDKADMPKTDTTNCW